MAASPMIFVIAALYKAAPYLLSGAFYSNVHFPTINIGYGMDYSAVAQMYADAVGKFWRALTVPQVLYMAMASILMEIALCFFDYGIQFCCLKASRGEKADIRDFFAGFASPVKIIIAELIRDIVVMVGALFFIVPGIILYFGTSQYMRVMMDNPQMSPMEAIKTSMKIMQGGKVTLFILQLSFIGWYLLSSLTSGISEVYSMPYLLCAEALLYDEMSDRYMGKGIPDMDF